MRISSVITSGKFARRRFLDSDFLLGAYSRNGVAPARNPSDEICAYGVNCLLCKPR